jgi:hypothetical protein
MVGHAF